MCVCIATTVASYRTQERNQLLDLILRGRFFIMKIVSMDYNQSKDLHSFYVFKIPQ